MRWALMAAILAWAPAEVSAAEPANWQTDPREATEGGPPPHARGRASDEEDDGGPPPHARRGGDREEDEDEAGPPVEAPRLHLSKTAIAPEIDGRLNEPLWQEAAVISNLTQADPEAGEPPSQRTEVRITYDVNFLYIGVRALDDEAGGIIAREMRRDHRAGSDDRLEFVLDTFHDRRNAYRMWINPLGARGDGLIEAGRAIGDEWDGIWYGRSSIDEHGWYAEIAIPFKTVSFDPNGSTWGFNIERTVRRYDESSRWTAYRHGRGLENLAEAGVLEGLHGIDKGVGLDLKPTATLRGSWTDDGGGRLHKPVPSLDAFYSVTPSMTAALTVNTDFAEAEVDEREINFSRFNLFVPEKRDFFLQDAGIFEFGRLKRNGRPFFSRRIGLDDRGREIDLLGGAKLTGRMGPLSVGVLDAVTGEQEDVGIKNLAVARATLDVLEQSRLGVIGTLGHPTEDMFNAVAGFDALYQNDEFWRGNAVVASGWIMRSFGDPPRRGPPDDRPRDDEEEEEEGGPPGGPPEKMVAHGRQWAFGGTFEYPNDPVEFSLGFTEIQENFYPALGFVNRTGIRMYEASARYRKRFRPGQFVRMIDTGAGLEVITDDIHNHIQTVEGKWDIVKVVTSADDSFKFGYRYVQERFDEDERIVGRIPVPAGTYHAHGLVAGIETSEARPLRVALEAGYGEFFHGTRLQVKPTVEWHPIPNLYLSASYEENRIRTSTGDLNVRVVAGRVVYHFTPDISIDTLIQYDNLSKELGINSRFRWTVKEGNDIYFIINTLLEEDEDLDHMRHRESEIIAKIAGTIRF